MPASLPAPGRRFVAGGRRGRPRTENRELIDKRDRELIFWREVARESYAELARRFGLTRQRIPQILRAAGRPDLLGRWGRNLGGRPSL